MSGEDAIERTRGRRLASGDVRIESDGGPHEIVTMTLIFVSDDVHDTVAVGQCPLPPFVYPFPDRRLGALAELVVLPSLLTAPVCLRVHRRHSFWVEHCGTLIGPKALLVFTWP